MPAFDPTAIPQSMPAPRGEVWSVDEVASVQDSMMLGAALDLAAGDPPVVADGEAAAAGTATPAEASALSPPSLTLVSGRYRSAGHIELELRIDIDGERPTRRVSGDFFRKTGATLAYAGSFLVNMPRITPGQRHITIEGEGAFTFASASSRVRITVPRVPPTGARQAADVRFLSSSGAPGAIYNCAFQSTAFRVIELEQDVVGNVIPFDSYDTASLPNAGRARTLSVARAFGEAGIEVIDTGGTNVIATALAGSDRIWTNRELHAAMTRNFSRLSSQPAWRVYLMAATIHEKGPGLRGIMFDSGKRQGCAVFHDVVGVGNTPDATARRAMLRTYVHELGHCFNLYHSHMKDLMSPPRPNRLDALSWMHYPDAYVGSGGAGSGAYWRAFPFQFDDEELVHLRHGFRDDVVPGGKSFGINAADLDPAIFAEPVADESGLALEIRAPAQFLLGTPVVVEFKLSLTDLRGRVANRSIHPNYGFTQLGIARAGQHPIVYKPLMTQCADPDLVELTRESQAIYDSAYVGYGKDGFYFDTPGSYELRALYDGPDGSRIMSNTLRIRIKSPLDRDEDELAELFIGDQQGALFTLLGSDSDALGKGRDALKLAADKYAGHPLADYAKLVEGMNASYPFKTVEPGVINTRPADYAETERLLADVCNAAMIDPTADQATEARGASPQADAVPRVDNITLNMAVTRLAQIRGQQGDAAAARTAADDLLGFLERDGVRPQVRDEVGETLQAAIAGSLEDGGGDTTAGEDAPPPPGRARRRRATA